MGIKERERRVEVFFYGLFMDVELLHGRGLEPEGGEIAAIDGFAGLVKRRLAGEPLPAVPKASLVDERSCFFSSCKKLRSASEDVCQR
jgi:hypothetical protein